MPVMTSQGWNPVLVLLVGALLVVSGIAWYLNSQVAFHKAAYDQLYASSHDKQTQASPCSLDKSLLSLSSTLRTLSMQPDTSTCEYICIILIPRV